MTPKPLREELSFRGYAKRRGVSHTAVEKAVKAGRLKRCLLKRGKWIRIDPALADQEWERNTDGAQQREPESKAGGAPRGSRPSNAGKPQETLFGPEARAAAEEAAAAGGKPEEPRGPTLTSVRTTELEYRSQLTKLDLDERMGQLVRTSEVAAESFRLGRHVQDALLRIPPRMTGVLMSETDPHAFERTLTTEILKVLEILAGDRGAHA